MTTETALLRAALDYASVGWPTFVLSRTKAPVANCDRCRAEHLTSEQMEACDCACCHGFYAASCDSARLREMARLHPRGLLAVRTGAPSGTAVIDVDPDGLAEMRELVQAGKLPRTVAAQTGRGGFHLFYAHPGGRIMSGAGKCGRGIDSKSDGGYCVVSPSIHPATHEPYRWLAAFTGRLTPLPAYWVQRLRPPAPPLVPASSQPPAQPATYASAALNAEVQAVATTPGGQRNDQLNKSSFSLGQLVAAGTLAADEVTDALMAAAATCGLVAEDGIRSCETTIRSGLRGGMANPRRPAA